MPKYLIIDLDGTAIVTTSQDIHTGLSANLVKHAREGGYDGFYVCTHRCHLNDQLNIFNNTELFHKSGLMIDPRALFVSSIVENFARATGLKLMKVSTPDDIGKTCGSGYENILLPYELAVLEEATRTKNLKKAFKNVNDELDSDEFKQTPVETFDDTTKNPQLTQIVQDMSKLHPKQNVTGVFVEDRLDLCETTLKMKMPVNNVMLSSCQHPIWHDKKYLGDKIELIGTIGNKPFASSEEVKAQISKVRGGISPSHDVEQPEERARRIVNEFEGKKNFDNKEEIIYQVSEYLLNNRELLSDSYLKSLLDIKKINTQKFFCCSVGGTEMLTFKFGKAVVKKPAVEHKSEMTIIIAP